MERRVRLGDVIDDYCTRCRRIMNHGIVGMVGDDVAKVRCNTCQSEHAYKHGRLPKRRRGETDRLFAEVLRGITGTDPEAEEAAADEAEDAAPDEKREAEDGDAGDADTPADSEEGAPEPADAPPPPEDEDHPAHGVRRRLFTIRRHSGGKAPVEGVSTDIGRPGGPVTGNRPDGQGGGRRGGRPPHGAQGAQGGQGGHGGRWPRRRGRRR